MPGPRQDRQRHPSAERGGAAFLLGGQTLTDSPGSQRLGTGRDMHGLAEVGEDLLRVGAVAMQLGEEVERLRDAPGQQLLEQVENPAAVGETQHRPHMLCPDAA